MKGNKKQIIVIGLGKFGMSMAKELSKYDCDVMAVDEDKNLVNEIAQYIPNVASVNAMDVDILQELGIKNYDIAIVGIGDDLEASITISLMLKELNVPYIIAKAREEKHEKLLRMIGVDKIIQPEKDIAVRVAKNLMYKNIIEKLDLGKDFSIAEISTPRKWIGKDIASLGLRNKYGINIVCIDKAEDIDGNNRIIPTPDYILNENDKLMIISPNTEFEKDGIFEDIVR